jgi:hypothetical protein
MCRYRVSHPLVTSREMWDTDSNDDVISVEKYMARMRPVTICDIRQIPIIDPMFHM